MRMFAMDLLLFGLWVLALARATRLLTKDEITDPLRAWVMTVGGGPESRLAYFVECPWCISMWLGFASAWFVFVLGDWSWWLYPAVALAGSYITGLMAENLEELPDLEVEEQE